MSSSAESGEAPASSPSGGHGILVTEKEHPKRWVRDCAVVCVCVFGCQGCLYHGGILCVSVCAPVRAVCNDSVCLCGVYSDNVCVCVCVRVCVSVHAHVCVNVGAFGRFMT